MQDSHRPAPPARARAWLSLALRGAVMVALLAVFVGSVSWEEARAPLADLELAWVPVVLGLYAAGQVCNGLGWRHLVRAGGIPVSLTEMVRHDLAAVFWSTVLPGSVAGELVKGVRVAGRLSEAETTAVALLSARMVGGASAGLLAAALWPLAALPSPVREGVLLAMGGVVALGLTGVLLLQAGPGVVRRLLPALAARLPEGRRPRLGELAVCALTSTAAHALFAGVYTGYFAAVGHPISYADGALIAVATTAAQALPITLGGFGVRELTMSALGATLVPAPAAAAAAVLGTLAFAVPVSLGGLSEWLLPPRRRVA